MIDQGRRTKDGRAAARQRRRRIRTTDQGQPRSGQTIDEERLRRVIAPAAQSVVLGPWSSLQWALRPSSADHLRFMMRAKALSDKLRIRATIKPLNLKRKMNRR